MLIPKIEGEFKNILSVSKYGNYVNDHCITKIGDGYRLLGITSFTGNPSDERYFINAYTDDILNKPFIEEGISINQGTLAWSPCVVKKDELFYCFYGPSPTKLAISTDYVEWMGYQVNLKNNPPLSMHRDHFVFKYKNKYLMYAVGIKDGRGCVGIMESKNLTSWKWKGYAFSLGKNATLTPGWGAIESPFIVKKGNYYYLFITYTDCSDETYNNTLVFASKNPYDFGTYQGDTKDFLVAKLSCHAPEIFTEKGNDYITTCGWQGKSKKGCNGVSMAKLIWEEK